MVDAATGLCAAHGPGAAERMAERGRKGGLATAERNKQDGLEEKELPPLTSPEVAELWLERIARAVATGRMVHQDATAATRAIQQWLKAHEVGKMARYPLKPELGDFRRRERRELLLFEAS